MKLDRANPVITRGGIIVIVIVIATTMSMVLSSYQCIATARVHPVHLTNVARSARRPPIFRPSQSSVVLHSPSPFITTQPKS